MTNNIPTREDLYAAGRHELVGTYQGPLTLEYAQEVLAELREKRYGWGQAVFPNITLVRQGEGYNVVYDDVPLEPWRPTGKQGLDDLIQGFCTDVRDSNSGVGKLYEGHGDSWSVERMLSKQGGWREQYKWRDGGHRAVWTNETLFAIATICEGDFHIHVVDTHEEFLKSCEYDGAFYEAPYDPNARGV